MYTREYQESEFFPDLLQTFIERCIRPEIPLWKNFCKNILSLLAGWSYKWSNQVATFTQSANSSTLWTFFHIWNLWGPMHLSINVWSWYGKNSESWYSLVHESIFKPPPILMFNIKGLKGLAPGLKRPFFGHCHGQWWYFKG